MTQAEKLVEEFPTAVLGKLPKAGGLTYVPVAEVITRLNNVCGVGGWGYSIIDIYRDSVAPEWVIATVELKADVDGHLAIRCGVGGYDTSNKGMDIADAHKSAVSEAIKKAAQALGVGLHLSRKEEAIAVDAMGPPLNQDDVEKFKKAMSESSNAGLKDAVKDYAKDNDIKWGRMSDDQLTDLRTFANAYKVEDDSMDDVDDVGPEQTQ